MSQTRTKLEYECECGMDWGGCSRKNVFLEVVDNSTDYNMLMHIHHFGEDDEHVTNLGGWNDEQYSKLIKFITGKESTESEWTEKEKELFKQEHGW